jgi:hypothetical protein
MARQALSNEQQKAIRNFYFVTQRRVSEQRDVISWFHRTHSRTLSQSQASIIFSDQYSHLDPVRSTDDLSTKKRRSCSWPEVEQALFTWQQAMQRKGATLSGEHLRHKATELWSKLAVYKDKDAPSFSNGWLERFERRRIIWAYA